LFADRVVVDHEAVHIEARGLRVDPEFGGMLGGLVTLAGLDAANLEIVLKNARSSRRRHRISCRVSCASRRRRPRCAMSA
jgi:hypothetical protein